MRHMTGLLLLLSLLSAPRTADSPTEAIDRIVLRQGLQDARIGIVVQSLEEGKTLYRRGGDVSLRLASNTKLLTCAAALNALGPDHSFQTRLHLLGPGKNHAEGLVVTGTGDPHISGRDFGDNPVAVFEKWAEALKKRGVLQIRGPLILVVDKFRDDGTWPEWKSYPIDRWWAAPFAQFSLNDNCVDVLYAPGKKEGDPLRLTLRPDTGFVTVENRTRTVRSRARVPFQFTRKPGTNEIRFKGDWGIANRPGKTWVAIQDPTRFFGTVLKETLEQKGITVSGDIRVSEEKPEGLHLVAEHQTPLPRVLEVCLTNSQNFYAEMILLHLGWHCFGRGTRKDGLQAVGDFLREASIGEVTQTDGSGLARNNLASADQIIALLRAMDAHPQGKTFRKALARNGAEVGTLRRRMKGERYVGRVHAKTGHLAGVSTLSGYVDAENGETYVFSILVNLPGGGSTRNANRLQNEICELLIRGVE